MPEIPEYLAIGKLRRPHGVTGEMLMEVLTDFPERIKAHQEVYVGEKHQPLQICGIRGHASGLLVQFEGIITPDEIGKYRNQIVYIQSDQVLALPEGEYYYHELLGLAVIDQNGNSLGTVTEILETGANDVYVATDEEGRETLLPAIESVIIEIDIKNGVMRVHPPT